MSKFLFFLLVFFSLSGCVRGWVYTDTVEPFCVDMENTPVGDVSADSGIKTLAIPRIPGARTVWSSNAIADAARREGITHIEYCDRKLFSLFGGVWGSDSIVVYGR